MIDWAADTHAIATEVTPAGHVAWELKNDDGYLSYRAVKAVVPDTTRPAVSVSVPAAGASYAYGQRVVPAVRCTDRGGSSLRTCSAPRAALNTRAPGRHTFRVTATDGAGNSSTVTRTYTVAAAPYSRPDALIQGPRGWVGNNVLGSPARQQISRVVRRGGSASTWVRLQNEGNRADRVVVRGTGGNQRFRVRYYLGRTDFTNRVRAATFVKTLAPNRSVDLRVVVTRLRPATVGDTLRVVVLASSGLEPRRRDAVAETAPRRPLRATRRRLRRQRACGGPEGVLVVRAGRRTAAVAVARERRPRQLGHQQGDDGDGGDEDDEGDECVHGSNYALTCLVPPVAEKTWCGNLLPTPLSAGQEGRIPAARAGTAYASARDAIVSWALRPLGLGTTHSSAPSNRSG